MNVAMKNDTTHVTFLINSYTYRTSI